MKKTVLLAICLAMFLCSCTVVRPVSNDGVFTYSIQNGEAVITDLITSKRQLKIPSVFRGYPVTEIADKAFKDETYVRAVLFEGQNLRRIGKQAFIGTCISQITFPESLQVLEDEAFSESILMKSVTFSGAPKYIGNKAFYNCQALESVYFADGVQEIGACAFLKCSTLSDINLQSVARFGELSFGACYELRQDLVLSATEIGDRAFIACENIPSLKVENADKIGIAAFSDCKALTSVTLSDQIKSIPESCFEGCENLMQLNSVPLERVGAYAFHQCHALTDIELSDVAQIYASSIKNSGITAECIDDDDPLRIIDGKTYKRTFYDDFDGTELNSENWSRCPEWQRRTAYWRDEDTSVKNGTLMLDVSEGAHPDIEGRTAYFSGAIRSKGNFSQRYGYFEIRCNLSDLFGFWSAFWLMPAEGAGMADINNDGMANDGAEIDIYESPFSGTDKVNHAVHWDGYSTNHDMIYTETCIPGLYLGYHTFAFKWTEDEYVFYIDGEEMWRVTDPDKISHVKAYLKVTVEVGEWGGPIYSNNFPFCALLTDYVKVYAEE